jgi:hypothetical protein
MQNVPLARPFVIDTWGAFRRSGIVRGLRMLLDLMKNDPARVKVAVGRVSAAACRFDAIPFVAALVESARSSAVGNRLPHPNVKTMPNDGELPTSSRRSSRTRLRKRILRTTRRVLGGHEDLTGDCLAPNGSGSSLLSDQGGTPPRGLRRSALARRPS